MNTTCLPETYRPSAICFCVTSAFRHRRNQHDLARLGGRVMADLSLIPWSTKITEDPADDLFLSVSARPSTPTVTKLCAMELGLLMLVTMALLLTLAIHVEPNVIDRLTQMKNCKNRRASTPSRNSVAKHPSLRSILSAPRDTTYIKQTLQCSVHSSWCKESNDTSGAGLQRTSCLRSTIWVPSEIKYNFFHIQEILLIPTRA